MSIILQGLKSSGLIVQGLGSSQINPTDNTALGSLGVVLVSSFSGLAHVPGPLPLGSRDVAAPTIDVAALTPSRPILFVEIEWDGTTSSKLCSYGTLDWNGSTWSGAGITVAMDQDGVPSNLTLVDGNNAFRTFALADGVRDKKITIWLAYVDALGALDPVQFPQTYGDSADFTPGQVSITLGLNTSARQEIPHLRIGPSIGCNFLVPDGYVLHWSGGTITLTAGR